MSQLKGMANRLKGLEKASGVSEWESLIREVNDIIKQHQVVNPAFCQKHLWPLVELTFDEIRSLGRGEKVLEDFRPRWKISMQEWYDRRAEWREESYVSAIARFNKAHGDSYSEWELNYGEPNKSALLKGDGETDSGNGKLQ